MGASTTRPGISTPPRNQCASRSTVIWLDGSDALAGAFPAKLRWPPVRAISIGVAGVQEAVLKEVILTSQGYKKLSQEIEHLQTEKRREVAERIRVAREFGDIAENAEYDDAKNEQAMLEHRIAQL